MSKSKLVSNLAIAYFIIGFVFAIIFALYYHWPYLSFLSPGFYSVIFTWPIQLLGFARDFWSFGLAGKPI